MDAPTGDDLEDLDDLPADVREGVVRALARTREVVEGLPDDDTVALYMLPRWREAAELEVAAYRAARWAVATHYAKARADGDHPTVARLDELNDVGRAYLHERVMSRAYTAHQTLDLEGLPRTEGAWPSPPHPLPEEDGMLAWTRRILDHLERYRVVCADAPQAGSAWMVAHWEVVANAERDRWRAGEPLTFWHLRDDPDRGPAWLNLIALAVWVLEVEPLVRRSRRPAAMTLANLEGLGNALAYRGTVEVLDPLDTGKPKPKVWVAADYAALDREVLVRIQRATGLLGSSLAPRMLTLLVNRLQRRLDRDAPIVWGGDDGRNGWEALAEDLGIRDRKRVRDEVKPLFMCLSGLHYHTAHGLEVSGLWDYAYQNEGGGRGNVGRLIVKPRLALTGEGLRDRHKANRSLVPLPELEDHGWCAPLVGSPRNHGAYARLWLWTLCRLREDADDLTRGYGVLIPTEQWAPAANGAGVMDPPPLLVPSRLVGRWAQDSAEAPAVLEEVAPNRYHLARHLEAERAMLEEAGRRMIDGSKDGKRSADRRADPNARRGRKPR